MPSGIAVRVDNVDLHGFYRGSALFRLYPSLGMTEDDDNHVVVALSPAAADHGLPETTVFRCDATGNPARWGGLDRGAEALLPNARIVGRFDIEAALANLGAGYMVVNADEVLALQSIAVGQAQACCRQRITRNEEAVRDYAANNWGWFAARHLVEQKRHPAPLQSVNHVFSSTAIAQY